MKTQTTENAQANVKDTTKKSRKATAKVQAPVVETKVENAENAAPAEETKPVEEAQEVKEEAAVETVNQEVPQDNLDVPQDVPQNAEETPAKKGLQPMPKFGNFDEACTHIKGLDNNELFKFARRLRVTWTGTNNDGINRMRAMMAIKDYYKRNLPKAV